MLDIRPPCFSLCIESLIKWVIQKSSKTNRFNIELACVEDSDDKYDFSLTICDENGNPKEVEIVFESESEETGYRMLLCTEHKFSWDGSLEIFPVKLNPNSPTPNRQLPIEEDDIEYLNELLQAVKEDVSFPLEE